MDVKQHSFILLVCILLFSLLFSGCDSITGPATSAVPGISPTVPGTRGTLIIGGLFDLSGPTSEEGKEYAAGVRAYTTFFNSNNSVGGPGRYKIELKEADFAAQAPEAIENYQRLLKEGAVAFIGWNDPDSLAISRQTRFDHVPFLSASYDENLVNDLKTSPYSFMIAPSYSDQLKIALLYAKRNRSNPGNPDPTGVGFLYSDNNFGRFPYQTGRDYSAQHHISWYHEGVLLPEINPANLLSEANRLRIAHPEFTFVQTKPSLTAQMLKTMQALDVVTTAIGLNYSASLDFPQTAGKAAEGFMVTSVLAQPGEQVPGFSEIQTWLAAQAKNHPFLLPGLQLPYSINSLSARFIQGWTTMKVLLEGVRKAAATNLPPEGEAIQLTGENVKDGLESLNNFDTGGITPLISFSKTNHKGTDIVRILKVEKGRWKVENSSVSLSNLEHQDSQPQPTSTPLPVPTATATWAPAPAVFKTAPPATVQPTIVRPSPVPAAPIAPVRPNPTSVSTPRSTGSGTGNTAPRPTITPTPKRKN